MLNLTFLSYPIFSFEDVWLEPIARKDHFLHNVIFILFHRHFLSDVLITQYSICFMPV